MMRSKRIINIIAILLMLFAAMSLSAKKTTQTKSFRMLGGYDVVVDVDIKGIAAQEMQGLIGMPFDITDKSVLSSNRGEGREIAKWSMLGNVPFLIKIDASAMHLQNLLEGQLNDSNTLNYQITMDYKLVYEKDGISSAKQSRIKFNIGNKTQNPEYSGYPQQIDGSPYKTRFCFDIFEDISVADTDTFVGSLDGSISFKFDEDASIKVFDNDAFPSGNYSSVLKITLETK